MFNRVNPSANRILDPFRPLRMGHYFYAAAIGGLLHNHIKFGRTELGKFRVIGRAHHPARRADFDNVRPGAQHFAHFLAHIFHAITDVARHAWIGWKNIEFRAGRHPTVAVTAGDRERGNADLHARANDQPLLHRLFNA